MNILICIVAVVILISNVINLNGNAIYSKDEKEEFILNFDNHSRELSEKYNSRLAVALIENGQIAFTKGYGYLSIAIILWCVTIFIINIIINNRRMN